MFSFKTETNDIFTLAQCGIRYVASLVSLPLQSCAHSLQLIYVNRQNIFKTFTFSAKTA